MVIRFRLPAAFLPALCLVALLFGGPCARADDAITANFDSDSKSAVDGYPGDSGDGWAGPWSLAPSQGGLEVTLTPSDTPPHQMLKFSFTSAGEATPCASVFRSVANNYRSFDLMKPYEVSFDFKPEALPPSPDDAYMIFSAPTRGIGTGPTDTWIIRGTRGQWYWGNGDKTGNATQIASRMEIAFGKTYHFVIDVMPETQSWTVSISDGSNQVKSDTLNFRSSSPEASPFIGFGVQMHTPNVATSASIGSIQFKAIEDVAK